MSDEFNERIQKGTYKMKPGDLLFCYTDGLTDIVNEQNERYEDKRLYQLLTDLKNSNANEIVSALEQNLKEFQGNAEQFDDMTMIVLKRL